MSEHCVDMPFSESLMSNKPVFARKVTVGVAYSKDEKPVVDLLICINGTTFYLGDDVPTIRRLSAQFSDAADRIERMKR